MMVFVYAAILLVAVLIVVTNVQPFKKAVVGYPSNDLVFLTLLSLSLIAITGRDVASRENISPFHAVMTMLAILSIVVPLFYIASFIMLWLITRIKQMYHFVNRYTIETVY